ncbi:hypothetical protein C7C46_03700 [Streptomyces tateyamensis]|uniref:Spore-associated protein A n=1 Tax=Streptomyces tateyamensis TaxID=565073 RepID=A0A2V4NM99_9ACTN|nr:peptidase inhibitor family I36 protein [Streptomyces tateyamensis]PYC87634.1 hypothetical protein C7C46_03700 [Streptomyces tateyamensis]
MRIKHALALGLAGAAVATLGAAGTAGAATGNSVTLYEGTGFTGPSVVVTSSMFNDCTLHYSDGTPVSAIGSVYNGGPTGATLYTGVGYQGAARTIAPFSGYSGKLSCGSIAFF